MPEYAFIRSDDESISSLIFYKMSEAPSVGTEIVDEEGIKWRRVFTRPNSSIATRSDPYSVSDFNKSLDGKKVTVGDMWDASKEASERRAAKEGKDPVREKYFSDYSKARKGQEHQIVKKERFEAKQKELGIKIKAAL